MRDAISCICDADAAEFWLDWLAHALQHPAVKPCRAVALVGDAVGKTLLVDLVLQLLPTIRMYAERSHQLLNSTVLENALVVVAYRESTELMSLISDEVICIRRPNQPCREVRSCHRVLLIPSTPPDREKRCTTIRCGSGVKALPEHAIGAFRAHLMQRAVPETRFLDDGPGKCSGAS